jgi:hypothetical protein
MRHTRMPLRVRVILCAWVQATLAHRSLRNCKNKYALVKQREMVARWTEICEHRLDKPTCSLMAHHARRCRLAR